MATEASLEKLKIKHAKAVNNYRKKYRDKSTKDSEIKKLSNELDSLERQIFYESLKLKEEKEKKMAKRRLSMSKKNVAARARRAKASKKKTSKKRSKKKVAKKRGRKKSAKKSRSRKGTIPLEILEKRQRRLTALVKKRGGKTA